MKIICLADTHSLHQMMTQDIPDGDLLIHAGDLCSTGKLSEIHLVNKFFKNLPHKHKVVIAGNHDWSFQRNFGVSKVMLDSVTYLQDEAIEIDGLLIYGSPWQPAFNNWAFNIPRGSERLQNKWKGIPDRTDILITHGPPKGVLDLNKGDHLGCELLAPIVKKIRPSLHVFGHIHTGYGKLTIGGTTYVNASICNEDYEPINKPIVVNI